MLSDIASTLTQVTALLDKRRATAAAKNRDRVLTAIYLLGANNGTLVSAEQLETDGGFAKLDIHDAIQMAERKKWLIENADLSSGSISWGLKPKARYYVEGLLQAAQANTAT